MRKYYLIGENIDSSLSPAIHNWIYHQYNIDALYSCRSINSIQFGSQMNSIRDDIESSNISGINITNPYKSLLPYSSFFPSLIISECAIDIDAINCIYRSKGKIMGDNTDWYGFIKSIEFNNINIANYNIIIIGAGGASKAIIYGLQKLGVNNFKIYNRSANIIKINNIEYDVLDIQDLHCISDSNLLVINCLPKGVIDNNFILSKGMINQIEIFYDLNYIRSEFHNIMELEDIKVIDGLDMLIYQAVKSVELWSNQEIIDRVSINNIRKYLLDLK